MSYCEAIQKFNVVILYDHVASAGRAMAAYSQLTRELDAGLVPELSIWRTDVAVSLECSTQAFVDIAYAEIVIVAVRGSQPCPAAFQRWIEGPAEDCGPPKNALIAIIDANDDFDLSPGTWNCILRGTAAKPRPDFFLWAPSAGAARQQQYSRLDSAESIHGSSPARINLPREIDRAPNSIGEDCKLEDAGETLAEFS